MNRKKIFLVVIATVVIVAVIGGYFGYQYWQKGTPQYSLEQLQADIKSGDTTDALKVVDFESIWNNFWPRFKQVRIRKMDPQGYNFALDDSVLEAQKAISHDALQNAVYSVLRGENQQTWPGDLFAQLGSLSQPQFYQNQDIATTKLTIKNYILSPVDITVVFTRQSDRSWHITDFQGMENIQAQTQTTSTQQGR